MNTGHSPLTTVNRRTVQEIEGWIKKKLKRGKFSRLFGAGGDMKKIVTWRSNLNTRLSAFNVCSLIYVWLLLTVRSQAAAGIITSLDISAIRHELLNTHDVLSNVEHGVENIQKMLQSQGETDGQHQVRSVISNTI